MQEYHFIFSDSKQVRLKRHIIFWLCWWAFCTFLYSFSPSAGLDISYIKRLELSAFNAFFYLGTHMFLAYTLMYYVVPHFILKGKYLNGAAVTVILIFTAALMAAATGLYVLNPLWKFVLKGIGINYSQDKQLSFFNALLAGLRGGITIGGFAAAIKLMKYLYLREQKNIELQKQNIASQLQLLKAQVHPHFLFNSLNNIFSHTQIASPQAPKLVAGLSDLLRYMLYECNQHRVHLIKELKMLEDYILLEKIRYNNQLEISVCIGKPRHDLFIAPLLLLPLLENAFKHGTSQVLEHPWISINVSFEGLFLKFKIVNSISPMAKNQCFGIGLKNVESRLELLYPQKHELRISKTEDAFVVTLNLELEEEVYGVSMENYKPVYA